MNYILDRKNNLYIIIVDNFNDRIFKKVINDILEMRNIKDKFYSYYTFFNKDCSCCILDFNKRNFNDDEVEELTKAYVKKK